MEIETSDSLEVAFNVIHLLQALLIVSFLNAIFRTVVDKVSTNVERRAVHLR